MKVIRDGCAVKMSTIETELPGIDGKRERTIRNSRPIHLCRDLERGRWRCHSVVVQVARNDEKCRFNDSTFGNSRTFLCRRRLSKLQPDLFQLIQRFVGYVKSSLVFDAFSDATS
jgi:hypothetical protein